MNIACANMLSIPLDRVCKLAILISSTRGTEMHWTNLIPGIPLFICLAILAYGFWTAEEGE
jgi:hypothetical protein